MAEFAATVAALIGRPLGQGEPFAVAVSGGPDSLALLLLAHAAFGDRLRALTVDHGLRLEGAAEATGVAALCVARGIAHATLVWEGDKPAASPQAAARAARYRLMGGWCAANDVAWLATAHHADDQAETMLMRLARGAGPAGLAGIRATRPLGGGVTLLRPLLGRRKAELVAIVAAAGLTPVDDPSNADPRFDRTRVRALLARTRWLDAGRLAAAAAHLAEAEAALAWTAELAWAGRATVSLHANAVIPAQAGTHLPSPVQEMGSRFRGNDGQGASTTVTLDAAGLPAELVRRLVARALAEIAPQSVPRGPALDRLIDRLNAGRTATLAGVVARGGTIWTFRRAPPRRSVAES